jgi:hypothetical protein
VLDGYLIVQFDFQLSGMNNTRINMYAVAKYAECRSLAPYFLSSALLGYNWQASFRDQFSSVYTLGRKIDRSIGLNVVVKRNTSLPMPRIEQLSVLPVAATTDCCEAAWRAKVQNIRELQNRDRQCPTADTRFKWG